MSRLQPSKQIPPTPFSQDTKRVVRFPRIEHEHRGAEFGDVDGADAFEEPEGDIRGVEGEGIFGVEDLRSFGVELFVHLKEGGINVVLQCKTFWDLDAAVAIVRGDAVRLAKEDNLENFGSEFLGEV